MKRVRKTEFRIPPPDEKSEMLRWQKIGGGDLHIANHILKPNERFWAARESLPQGFLDTIVLLSEEEGRKEKIEMSEKPSDYGYRIRARGGGWYDIVDKDGKQFNERSMRVDEANEMIASF